MIKKLKPMIYRQERTFEILEKGTYKGYNYYIVSYGQYPCAYIELPIYSKFYGKSYDDIPIDVHGGLTYSGCTIPFAEKDTWFIGWDYAHLFDFTGIEYTYPVHYRTPGKLWKTEEILYHCYSAIRQLRKLEIC